MNLKLNKEENIKERKNEWKGEEGIKSNHERWKVQQKSRKYKHEKN